MGARDRLPRGGDDDGPRPPGPRSAQCAAPRAAHGPWTARAAHAGRPGGAPWLTVTPAGGASSSALAALAHRLLATPRAMIVAGRAERTPELARLLPRLASALGWPLLADPMSGARRGPNAIAAYDLIFGPDGTVDATRSRPPAPTASRPVTTRPRPRPACR